MKRQTIRDTADGEEAKPLTLRQSVMGVPLHRWRPPPQVPMVPLSRVEEARRAESAEVPRLSPPPRSSTGVTTVQRTPAVADKELQDLITFDVDEDLRPSVHSSIPAIEDILSGCGTGLSRASTVDAFAQV